MSVSRISNFRATCARKWTFYECKAAFFRRGGGPGKKPGMRRKDYTPVSWDKYYERKQDVKVDENNVSF